MTNLRFFLGVCFLIPFALASPVVADQPQPAQVDERDTLRTTPVPVAVPDPALMLEFRRDLSSNETDTSTSTRKTSTTSSSIDTSTSRPSQPTNTSSSTSTSSTSSTSSTTSTTSTSSTSRSTKSSSTSHSTHTKTTPTTTPKPTSKTIVKTTTLPDGHPSTITSVHVITPGPAAEGTGTQSVPSLQTGAAEPVLKPVGREVVAVMGGAIGLAWLF